MIGLDKGSINYGPLTKSGPKPASIIKVYWCTTMPNIFNIWPLLCYKELKKNFVGWVMLPNSN